MNKQRVLITGSNGFLGRQLVSLLSSDETITLRGISRTENRNSALPASQFQQVDMQDFEALTASIESFKPDFIINTAADSSVDSCQQDPEACYSLNTLAVKQLADLAAEQGIFLIQLSTDFVFDGTAGPYRETDPTSPINVYGSSKVAAESFIQESGCQAAILRTILVYGAQTDPKRSNLILWVRDSLQQQKKIQVVQNQLRMPTFVNDLAKACQLVIQKRATGIFHISGAKLYSIYEIALAVADFWKLDSNLISPVPAESLAGAELRPMRTGFYIDKAVNELGFQPHTLEESLQMIDNNTYLDTIQK